MAAAEAGGTSRSPPGTTTRVGAVTARRIDYVVPPAMPTVTRAGQVGVVPVEHRVVGYGQRQGDAVIQPILQRDEPAGIASEAGVHLRRIGEIS